jgi:SAM-dependent methyltransferase
MIGSIETNSFLDVGCGSGLLTALIGEQSALSVGIDVKRHEDWKDCARVGCHFVVCDAQQLPFVSLAFDEAFAKDMLHHANTPRRALLEITRVTSERIIVLESNRYNPIMFTHMTMLLGHAHFKQRDFIDLIQSVDSRAIFATAEAHVLPSRPKSIVRILTLFLTFLQSKQMRALHAYNIAFLGGSAKIAKGR